MAIDKQFIVSLKGKEYPLWAGVLDAATRAGLRHLKTTVLQVPAPENGNLAVVMATAEFEDGRVFTDVGDCSPASTSPHLAAAALRLASTRAKGRALRDAINVGQTMYEELPGDDDDDRKSNQQSKPAPGRPAPAQPAAAPAARPAGPVATAEPPASPAAGPLAGGACETCGKAMNQAQSLLAQRNFNRNVCPACAPKR